jgi:hypothetical protein
VLRQLLDNPDDRSSTVDGVEQTFLERVDGKDQIGVRMALGANAQQVIRLFLREGFFMVLTGGLSGAALALAGTVVVLDVFSGARIDTVGLAWALGAAVCAACYFLLSDRVTADGSGLNSVTLAAGGLIVGAATVAALGLAGVLPLTFTTHDTVIAGHRCRSSCPSAWVSSAP